MQVANSISVCRSACVLFLPGIRAFGGAGRCWPLRVIINLHDDLRVLSDIITTSIESQLCNDDIGCGIVEHIIMDGRAMQKVNA